MKILNITKNIVIAQNAKEAKNFCTRLKGLLGKCGFSPEDALVIDRCQAIHMFFMKFAIDVVFVSSKKQVVGIIKNIKPFRLSPFFFKARYAVELPEGTIEKHVIEIGDYLNF